MDLVIFELFLVGFLYLWARLPETLPNQPRRVQFSWGFLLWLMIAIGLWLGLVKLTNSPTFLTALSFIPFLASWRAAEQHHPPNQVWTLFTLGWFLPLYEFGDRILGSHFRPILGIEYWEELCRAYLALLLPLHFSIPTVWSSLRRSAALPGLVPKLMIATLFFTLLDMIFLAIHSGIYLEMYEDYW